MTKFGLLFYPLALWGLSTSAQDNPDAQPDTDAKRQVVPVPSTDNPVQVGQPLVIPDELSAAVLPYLICLQSASGVPIKINGELRYSPPDDENCSSVRAKAAKDAESSLRRSRVKMDSKEQAALIEDTLKAIERFAVLPPIRSSEMNGE